MIALFLLLVIVAMVLGIVGVVAKGLLYLLFIVMPLSGYLNVAAAGHSASFFGLAAIPPLVARSG